MTQRPPLRQRRFTHVHLQRLDRAAEHYIDECCRRRTAVRASEFAASFLHVSLPYLSRIVPAIAGKTLRQFLLGKQLIRAEQLLRRTSLPANEVAIRCGFGTPGTFHRRFLQAYGVTPSTFREVKK